MVACNDLNWVTFTSFIKLPLVVINSRYIFITLSLWPNICQKTLFGDTNELTIVSRNQSRSFLLSKSYFQNLELNWYLFFLKMVGELETYLGYHRFFSITKVICEQLLNFAAKLMLKLCLRAMCQIPDTLRTVGQWLVKAFKKKT